MEAQEDSPAGEDLKAPRRRRQDEDRCGGSVIWKTGLAAIFVLINCLWLLRNTICGHLHSIYFNYFQIIFNSLGFLLVQNAEEVQGRIDNAVVYICVLETLFSIFLLQGVVKTLAYRLEEWIFLRGVMGMVNALYYLDSLCNPDVSLLESPLSLLSFLIPFLGYYFFNGIYCWQFFELRQKYVEEASLPRSSRNNNNRSNAQPSVCCCNNETCLSFTALLNAVICLILLALLFHAWQKPQFQFYYDDVFTSPVTEFIVLTMGMVSSIFMLRANIQNRERGIQLWIAFQVSLALIVFGLLAHVTVTCHAEVVNDGKDQFIPIVVVFLLFESPIVLMIWLGYVRLKEVKRPTNVVSNSAAQTGMDFRTVYMPDHQSVTISVG